jgi:flagellar hook-length control protein FliK
LGGAKTKDIGRSVNAQSGKPDKASSFEQVLKSKVSDKPTDTFTKSDKDAKANTLKKDSVSVQKKLDDAQPARPQTEKAEVRTSKNEPRTAPKEEKSWEEPGSVKEKSASEKPGKKSESSSPDREQVMLEFMDSMESEFGIPPQRMVAAMTSISDSDQLSSPEDSASQVIAQLELPKDQEERALALYVGMLSQLKQTQEPVMKPVLMGGAAAAATAPILMNAQQKREVLNNSLDQMNQKFFMKPNGMNSPQQMAPQQNMAQMNPQMSEMSDEMTPDQLQTDALPQDKMSFDKQGLGSDQVPSFGKGAGPLKPDQPMQPQGHQSYGASVKALQEKLQNSKIDPNSAEGQQLAKSLAALSVSAAALDQGIKNDPQNMQALKAEQVLNRLNDSAGASAAAMAGLAALGYDGDDGGDDDMDSMGQDSSSGGGQFAVPQGNAHLGQHQRADTTTHAGQSFGAMMAGAQAQKSGEAEKQANIQSLMNQAEYMIKKGGGEAKIQMAPEGIGQVHMKVSVIDGKVNLEMSAETKEAKKLIESSLSDLKSSLGQHRLSMEHVKVDVGTQLANDQKNPESQNQRQMDMRQDQQAKDQTREFWNQFGDGGGFDRRGTFFDNPGIRAYGGTSRTVEALTPNSSGAVAQKAYTGSGKGRGLNLVA